MSLIGNGIMMQKAPVSGGIATVVNYEDTFGCSSTAFIKNGSFYIGAGGNGGTDTGTIATGDTFYGNSSADCYGTVTLYVYSSTRGYLYASSSSVGFGPSITSGTYTRITGENITITGQFNGSEPPPPCFVSGTMISLPDGTSIPIEELSVGRELQSVLIESLIDTNNQFDLHMWSSEELNETRVTSSIDIFKKEEVSRTIIVNNGLLEATYNHIQLARVNGIWRMIRIEHLGVGDILYDINGNLVPVTSIEINDTKTTVYRLTLSDKSHTYFANNILTHNIKAGGGIL